MSENLVDSIQMGDLEVAWMIQLYHNQNKVDISKYEHDPLFKELYRNMQSLDIGDGKLPKATITEKRIAYKEKDKEIFTYEYDIALSMGDVLLSRKSITTTNVNDLLPREHRVQRQIYHEIIRGGVLSLYASEKQRQDASRK